MSPEKMIIEQKIGTHRRVALCMLLSLLTSGNCLGSIVIETTRVSASTNAFAPLDRSGYFDEQIIRGVSPAVVTASGDWTGTNYGGTTPTWHWIGTARAEIATSLTPTQLTVTGQGSFSMEITTTPDFISPSKSTILYAPGSGAGASCSFILEEPGVYRLHGVATPRCGFTLASYTTNEVVFKRINDASDPELIDKVGFLPAGRYIIGGSSASYGVTNVGASHEIRAGSFTDFLFTVQVPEPSSLAWVGAIGLVFRRPRQRQRGSS